MDKVIKDMAEVLKTSGCKYVRIDDGEYSLIFTDGETAEQMTEDIYEWIPCSERLPEKSEWHLAYTDNGNFDVIYFSKKHQKWNVFDESTEANHAIEVSAWMPLPEPYEKGGDSDETN